MFTKIDGRKVSGELVKITDNGLLVVEESPGVRCLCKGDGREPMPKKNTDAWSKFYSKETRNTIRAVELDGNLIDFRSAADCANYYCIATSVVTRNINAGKAIARGKAKGIRFYRIS